MTFFRASFRNRPYRFTAAFLMLLAVVGALAVHLVEVYAACDPTAKIVTFNVQTGGSITVSPPTGGETIGGGATTRVYPLDTGLSLTAEADDGYSFLGWTGALTGTTTPTSKTVTSDMTIGATFSVAIPHELRVTQDPAVLGTLTTSAVDSQGQSVSPFSSAYDANTLVEVYPDGTIVTISIDPGVHVFDGWTGAVTDSQPQVTVTMTADRALTAHLSPSVALTLYYPNGQGYLTWDAAPRNNVSPGDPSPLVLYYPLLDFPTIHLTPVAELGYAFYGWDGNHANVTVPFTVTDPSQSGVEADFCPAFPLTVNTTGTGTGSVSVLPSPQANGAYADGTVVTLTATPASGSGFYGWSGAITGSTSPETLTMSAAKTVNAEFRPLYAFSADLIGEGTVKEGSSVVAMDERFTDGDYSGWTIAAGYWSVVDSAMQNSLSSLWSKFQCDHRDMDYDLEFSYTNRSISSGEERLVVMLRDDTAGNDVRLNFYPNRVLLDQHVNGVYMSLATNSSATTQQDTKYYVRVVCSGADVTVYRGTEPDQLAQILAVTNANEDKTTSNMAFFAAPNALFTFDDIVVRSRQGRMVGTQMTLSATAPAGMDIVWSGDITGSGTPISFTMDSPKAITTVIGTLHALSLSVAPDPSAGTITLDPAPHVGTNLYVEGTVVNLSATSSTPYYGFKEWQGDITSTANPVSVTVQNNVNATAVFAPLHSVSGTISGQGFLKATDGDVLTIADSFDDGDYAGWDTASSWTVENGAMENVSQNGLVAFSCVNTSLDYQLDFSYLSHTAALGTERLAVYLRRVDDNNTLRLKFETNRVELDRTVAGVTTVLAANADEPSAANIKYYVRVLCMGPSVTVYRGATPGTMTEVLTYYEASAIAANTELNFSVSPGSHFSIDDLSFSSIHPVVDGNAITLQAYPATGWDVYQWYDATAGQAPIVQTGVEFPDKIMLTPTGQTVVALELGEILEFPDANLKQTVLDCIGNTAIGNPTVDPMPYTENILRQHVQGLAYLQNDLSIDPPAAASERICSLQGINALTDLVLLSLIGHNIGGTDTNGIDQPGLEDPNLFAGMDQLEQVRFQGNTGITTVEALAHPDLSNLTTVRLASCPTAHISALAGLGNITALGFAYVNPTAADFGTIAQLSGLVSINLSGNGLVENDLLCLSNLRHLRSIILANNNLAAIQPLVDNTFFETDLSTVAELIITGNPLSDANVCDQIWMLVNPDARNVSVQYDGTVCLRSFLLSESDANGNVVNTSIDYYLEYQEPGEDVWHICDYVSAPVQIPANAMLRVHGPETESWRVVQYDLGDGTVVPATDGVGEFRMLQDRVVTAIVEPLFTPCFLTIDIDGNGTANADPTQPYYEPGTPITLHATASPGSQHYGWYGDVGGEPGNLDFIIWEDTHVVALFAAPSYFLDVQTTGRGLVSPLPDFYSSGDLVHLEATAEADYTFDHWEGDATGTTSSCTLTMDSSKSVRAVFAYTGQTTPLSIYTSESEGGNVQVTYDPITGITRVEAIPDTGYEFGDWIGDFEGLYQVIELSATGEVLTGQSLLKSLVPPEYSDGEGRPYLEFSSQAVFYKTTTITFIGKTSECWNQAAREINQQDLGENEAFSIYLDVPVLHTERTVVNGLHSLAITVPASVECARINGYSGPNRYKRVPIWLWYGNGDIVRRYDPNPHILVTNDTTITVTWVPSRPATLDQDVLFLTVSGDGYVKVASELNAYTTGFPHPFVVSKSGGTTVLPDLYYPPDGNWDIGVPLNYNKISFSAVPKAGADWYYYSPSDFFNLPGDTDQLVAEGQHRWGQDFIELISWEESSGNNHPHNIALKAEFSRRRTCTVTVEHDTREGWVCAENPRKLEGLKYEPTSGVYPLAVYNMSAEYYEGDYAILKAQPRYGYIFDHWEGFISDEEGWWSGAPPENSPFFILGDGSKIKVAMRLPDKKLRAVFREAGPKLYDWARPSNCVYLGVMNDKGGKDRLLCLYTDETTEGRRSIEFGLSVLADGRTGTVQWVLKRVTEEMYPGYTTRLTVGQGALAEGGVQEWRYLQIDDYRDEEDYELTVSVGGKESTFRVYGISKTELGSALEGIREVVLLREIYGNPLAFSLASYLPRAICDKLNYQWLYHFYFGAFSQATQTDYIPTDTTMGWVNLKEFTHPVGFDPSTSVEGRAYIPSYHYSAGSPGGQLLQEYAREYAAEKYGAIAYEALLQKASEAFTPVGGQFFLDIDLSRMPGYVDVGFLHNAFGNVNVYGTLRIAAVRDTESQMTISAVSCEGSFVDVFDYNYFAAPVGFDGNEYVNLGIIGASVQAGYWPARAISTGSVFKVQIDFDLDMSFLSQRVLTE